MTLARKTLLQLLGWSTAALTLLAFPFGPLFPWSPWKPGYEHLALARADVYYPSGRALPEGFREIDRDITESERFHRLTVRRRISVILCRDWSDFRRFMPPMIGKTPGAVVIQTGTVIYVTPRVAERGFDHGEFVRHELAHATVHQNQGWVAAFQSNRAEPFIEGLACWFARQRAFKTPADVRAFVMTQDIGPHIYPAERTGSGDMRLKYPLWWFFLEHLAETGGRDRFQELLLGTMERPGDYPAVFARVYHRNLGEAARDFERDVRTGVWAPRE